jgi:hypothetical protein
MTNEKFEQIMCEPETVEHEGVEFTVTPMTVEDFGKVQMKGEGNEAAALVEMVYQSLKDEEDIDRNGVRNAPIGVLAAVQDKIEEVNNIEDFFDEDEKQEALEGLA